MPLMNFRLDRTAYAHVVCLCYARVSRLRHVTAPPSAARYARSRAFYRRLSGHPIRHVPMAKRHAAGGGKLGHGE